MRKLLIAFSVILIGFNPVNACPIPEKDKDDILSELCSLGEKKIKGKWENSSLNNTIIFINYGKLAPENSSKGNRMLAGLTCSFRNYKKLNYLF